MFVQKVVASASFPHFDSRKGSRIGTRFPLLGSENGACGVQEVDFPHLECQLDLFEGLGINSRKGVLLRSLVSKQNITVLF